MRPSSIDESRFEPDARGPIELTKLIALAKAMDVARAFPEQIVIGADTVVDADGKVIGKPKDAADAARIIRLLFSRPHRVITGLAVVRIRPQTQVLKAQITTVYPRPMNEAQIAQYIASGAWQGKAGAYGIQDYAEPFIERIEGSFTNVVGLPMELLAGILHRLGYHPK